MKMHIQKFEIQEAEAEKRWGKTEAYKEYSEKSNSYTEETLTSLAGGLDEIFAEFASLMCNSKSADSADAQNIVKKLQAYITKNYYTCTKEMLSYLGRMYVHDERFKSNIDNHAEGTADFASRAIEFYCK